jgi:hypothetical protein
MPEHPTFQIEARTPEESDARNELCAEWAEVILSIDNGEDDPGEVDLTRAAGEAIIQVLGDVMHRWAGKSILDSIWEELDLAMDSLMDGEPEDEERGYARGLATAIAYLYNPINPDVQQIRADAVERWEERSNPFV